MPELNPADFLPSRAEQKRARKREAQRKYRRGVQLRFQGADSNVAGSAQSTAGAMAAANAEPLWKPARTHQQGQHQHGIHYHDVSLDFVSARPSSIHAPESSLGAHIDQVLLGEAYQLSSDDAMLGPGGQTALDCSLRGLARFGDDMATCPRDELGGAGSLHGADGRCAHAEHAKERVETRRTQGNSSNSNSSSGSSSSSSSSSKWISPRSCQHASPCSAALPPYFLEGARTVTSPPATVSGGHADEAEPAAPAFSSRRSSLTPGLQGCTPLFQAVVLGNLGIVTILTGRNYNINAPNETGQTVLHIAAREGHADMVDLLLKRGAHVNASDCAGNTPLHLAVMHGWEHVVRILVDAGANVNMVNYPSS